MAEYQDGVAAAFARMADTRDGKIILDYLNKIFVHRPLCSKPEVAALKAAQHDVIIHIEGIIEHGRRSITRSE